ncbi:hypothetical protein CK203_113536 [Vitis vinifera]|uniref:Uncharacterized protein n=1 Tax=Vitis vinifera TaxID=29760 RepID=A0A438E8F9_VITVI|nr:hypothetical protein CK203_113536 [Vitis vinifera]
MQLKRPVGGSGGRKPKSAFDDPDRLAIVLVKGPPPKKPVRRASTVRTPWAASGAAAEIEVSCASAHDAHPDGGEVEMATETSAAPVIISDEDVEVRIRDKSYLLFPHLRRNLLTMQLLLALSAMRSWNIYVFAFLFACQLVRGLRGMAQQHDLFTQLLQTADYMRTFSSRRQEIENQLRLRMEEAEANYPPCERKMKPSEWSWLRRRVEESTAGPT